MIGKVNGFNMLKRLCFIGRDDWCPDVSFITRNFGDGYRTLTEGDSVEFEIVQGPKGLQAANVEKRLSKYFCTAPLVGRPIRS